MMKLWTKQTEGGDWDIMLGDKPWGGPMETKESAWAEMLFLYRVHTLDLSMWMNPVNRMETYPDWPDEDDTPEDWMPLSQAGQCSQ
jgi:hypothetical protein